MNRGIRHAGIAAALCAGLLGAAGARAGGFDPASADILGLRLGAPQSAVLAALRRHGIRAGAIARSGRACGDEARCVVTLAAATRDGDLVVTLRGDPLGVAVIAYRFRGNVLGEAEIITASVLEYFGPPDESSSMAWCSHPAPDRRCRESHPSLRFDRDTLTLTLTSGQTGP